MNNINEIMSIFQQKLDSNLSSKSNILRTGIIVLTIDSEELASKVHTEIQKLIEEKNYPVEEESWTHAFSDPTTYCFRFKY